MKLVKIEKLSEEFSTFNATKWLKKTGDNVIKGEPLIELELDKCSITLNAEVSGTLTILKIEGIKVGDTIAAISVPTIKINIDN